MAKYWKKKAQKRLRTISYRFDSMFLVDQRNYVLDQYNPDESCNGICEELDICTDYQDLDVSMKRSLKLLRCKVLQHKWGDAVPLLLGIASRDWRFRSCESRQSPQVVWRIGNELLLNHPSTPDAENLLSSHRRSMDLYMDTLDQTQVLLEYVFKLLCEHDYTKAKDELSAYKYVDQSLVRKEVRFKNIEFWTNTADAYIGLIEYVHWRSLVGNEPLSLSQYSIGTDQEAREQKEKLAEAAMCFFQKVIYKPGIWDTFMMKHIEILLFYYKFDKLRRDLTLYSELHLENPNAHKYLYQVLQAYIVENDDSVHQLKIAALRRLHEVSPADSLMINLHNLLFDDALSNCKKLKKFDVESQQFNDLVYAFEVLMDLLDYPCWSSSKQPWVLFSESISTIRSHLKQNQFKLVASKLWKESGRYSWWPTFHFAVSIDVEDEELYQAKSFLTSVFHF